MDSWIVGEGKPEVCIVAGIHGDEPETVKALDRVIENHEFNKSFKAIIANEEALLRNERFIDCDMNRVFPGNKESDRHEEVLAAKLLDEIGNLKTINLHSTASKKTPFSVISGESREQEKLAGYTGIEKVIGMKIMENDISSYAETVGIEASRDEKGVDELYRSCVNFLKAHDVIEGDHENIEFDLFQVYDTADGAGFEFTAENFEKVNEGETYAVKEEVKKTAKNDFWPVLASTDGYEDIIGFKSRKIDR
jgi:predicted deacylase